MIHDSPPSDRERSFTGRIDELGALHLDRPVEWWGFLLARRSEQIVLTVAPLSEIRSKSQNRYWWGVVVERVRAFYEGLRRAVYTKHQIHGMLLGTFVGTEKTPLGIPTYISSRTLSTERCSQLFTDVREFYVHHDPPLIIPAPGEPDEEAI